MINEAISHYRILRQLGTGGMGTVYLAEDTRLRRSVALKILPANVSADGEARRRFTQEARAASALNHPNIIGIYDIGTDEGHDFIAMEFVEGEQLRGPLPRKKDEIKRAVEFVAQVASGLAAAHRVGICHRDIKPDNLMVTRAGQVKILDFGLAQGWAKATPEKVTNFPESGLFLEDPQISCDGHELFYSRARTTGDIWLIKTGQSHQ